VPATSKTFFNDSYTVDNPAQSDRDVMVINSEHVKGEERMSGKSQQDRGSDSLSGLRLDMKINNRTYRNKAKKIIEIPAATNA